MPVHDLPSTKVSVALATRQNLFKKTLASVFTALAVLLVPSVTQAQTEAPSKEMVVTLLGTGTPLNDPKRFGFSNLVQAGGLNLLIDAGRGASIRLGQLGVPLGKIDAVFISHFHSDHINGLGDIYSTGYIPVPTLGGRKEALNVYGPVGTKRLVDGMRAAYALDVETRMADGEVKESATQMTGHEFEEGVVFERNGVRVTMFKVFHGENIEPSVGYRVDYDGRSVVFSSDTKYHENVVKHGKGVDLLVHETGAAPIETMKNPVVQTILNHHASPEDAGRAFSEAGPKMAAYSHVVRLFGPNGQVTMTDVVQRTRETYSGPLVVGEDLMQFRLSDKGVSVMQATTVL